MKWKLELRKVSELKDYYKNPRRLTKEQAAHLEISIAKFGVIDKPIITQNNVLIGGHQRKNILKRLKIKEIECWVPERDLTDKEIEELNIRLNKNTGEWNFDVLANEFHLPDLITWGFTIDEFNLDAENVTQETEEDDCNLRPSENPQTKLGDLYELNEHRLVCGDSTDKETVDKLFLDNKTTILMVTDPPYGVEYDASWRSTEIKDKRKRAHGQVKNDAICDWSEAWKHFPGDIVYVWHSPTFVVSVIESLEKNNFEMKYQIIWNKSRAPLARGDYHWKHEPCIYAVRKGKKHNWQGSRKETTVWDIKILVNYGRCEDDERTAHSTQKRIECMAKPIRNNSAKGEGIYDPFLGSGTTLIAAEQLDRYCFGIELSPAYCDIIVERWVNWMKKNNKPYTLKKNNQPFEWNDGRD